MKKAQEKGKLLAMTIAASKEKFGLTSDSLDFTYDSPMTVRFYIGKDDFYIYDETHKIACKFTEQALFWLKLYYNNMDVDDLEKHYIFLTEYAYEPSPCEKNQLKVHLIIHAMSLVDKEDAKEYKYSIKKTEDVMENTQVIKDLESARKAYKRNALSKKIDPDNVPDLEGMLTNKKSKDRPKPTKHEDEKTIIGLKEIKKAEKMLNKNVKILLDHEAKIENKVKAGSEGNLERDKHLSKVIGKVTNKRLVEYLKDHGTLDKMRDSAKSPVKRGRMPRDMAARIEEIKKLETGKRSRPDGPRSRSATPRKKLAAGDKKAVPVKKNKPRKSSRSTSKKKTK